MSVQVDGSNDKKGVSTAKPRSTKDDQELHVPEWAEDMEHTLRRLINERQKKRDQNRGLYR